MARRRGSGRGGYREPSSPAAVSPPGSLSQRTDGGPSAGSYRVSGMDYGDNKAVNQQIQSAPMEPQGGGGPQRQGGAAGPGPQGIFGPTDRPDEPLTAGVDAGPGEGAPREFLAEDPYLMARALYQVAPSPQLERLMARLARG